MGDEISDGWMAVCARGSEIGRDNGDKGRTHFAGFDGFRLKIFRVKVKMPKRGGRGGLGRKKDDMTGRESEKRGGGSEVFCRRRRRKFSVHGEAQRIWMEQRVMRSSVPHDRRGVVGGSE